MVTPDMIFTSSVSICRILLIYFFSLIFIILNILYIFYKSNRLSIFEITQYICKYFQNWPYLSPWPCQSRRKYIIRHNFRCLRSWLDKYVSTSLRWFCLYVYFCSISGNPVEFQKYMDIILFHYFTPYIFMLAMFVQLQLPLKLQCYYSPVYLLYYFITYYYYLLVLVSVPVCCVFILNHIYIYIYISCYYYF